MKSLFKSGELQKWKKKIFKTIIESKIWLCETEEIVGEWLIFLWNKRTALLGRFHSIVIYLMNEKTKS